MMCSVDFRHLTRHSLLKKTRRGHFGPRLNTPLLSSKHVSGGVTRPVHIAMHGTLQASSTPVGALIA